MCLPLCSLVARLIEFWPEGAEAWRAFQASGEKPLAVLIHTDAFLSPPTKPICFVLIILRPKRLVIGCRHYAPPPTLPLPTLLPRPGSLLAADELEMLSRLLLARSARLSKGGWWLLLTSHRSYYFFSPFFVHVFVFEAVRCSPQNIFGVVFRLSWKGMPSIVATKERSDMFPSVLQQI